MITDADIRHWRTQVPWVDADNVEQDLLLSRMIIEIANHPLLSKELVFRGGTCFHKLWLDRPWRYSEDLDYVRTTSGGIGDILNAVRDIATDVGFDRAQTRIGQHPKVRLDSTFDTGNPMRIKVEINTHELSPARPTATRTHVIDSPWFSGRAEVPTFTLEELISTKIRALYQRSKGRDLFDLWLAVTHAGADPAEISSCFGPYRPDGWTANKALQNLDAKLADERFRTDLEPLVPSWPDGYSIEAGAEVARQIIDAVAR